MAPAKDHHSSVVNYNDESTNVKPIDANSPDENIKLLPLAAEERNPANDDSRNEKDENREKAIEHRLLSLEPCITVLSLSGLNISELPDCFEKFHSVLKADFSNNQLSYLPASVIKMQKLRVLNLSHNKFMVPPECLYSGLHLIKELDLSFNNLHYFNMPPLCLPLLKGLKITNNYLRCPPLWLFRDIPSNICYLELSDNCDLTLELNTELITHNSQMVSNRIIKLSALNCGLNEGNFHFIKFFTNLQHIDLGNDSGGVSTKNLKTVINSFQDIPLTDYPFAKKVTFLSIADTNISGITKKIISFTNLQTLNLSNNIINWLPNELCLLKNLKVLDASFCDLFFLPEELGSLTLLRELYLNKNTISMLPESFKNLEVLEILDLYNNNFTAMPDLSCNRRLKGFDICINDFEPTSEVSVGGHTLEYESLRDTLRKSRENCEDRYNTRREVLESTKSANSGDEYLEESSCSEFFSDEECEYKALCCERSAIEEENWDDDIKGDDYFDPTRVGRLSRQCSISNESLSNIPHYLKEKNHFFCPYKRQMQFWGTQREFSHCVEGQFDDVNS